MKKLLFLTVLGYLLLFLGCKKAKIDNPLDTGLAFRLELLDKFGQVTTTFKQGENFRFRFVIINKTSKQKSWNFRQESLNMNDDFFRVYKRFEDNKTVGKPILTPVFLSKIGFFPINDSLTLAIDWMPLQGVYYGRLDSYHFDNKPLPVGIYRTGFTNVFEFYGDGDLNTIHKTSPLTFNVNFEVK
jgi:hypothetical protein